MIKLTHFNGNEVTITELANDKFREVLTTTAGERFIAVFNKAPFFDGVKHRDQCTVKVDAYVRKGYTRS